MVDAAVRLVKGVVDAQVGASRTNAPCPEASVSAWPMRSDPFAFRCLDLRTQRSPLISRFLGIFLHDVACACLFFGSHPASHAFFLPSFPGRPCRDTVGAHLDASIRHARPCRTHGDPVRRRRSRSPGARGAERAFWGRPIGGATWACQRGRMQCLRRRCAEFPGVEGPRWWHHGGTPAAPRRDRAALSSFFRPRRISLRFSKSIWKSAAAFPFQACVPFSPPSRRMTASLGAWLRG